MEVVEVVEVYLQNKYTKTLNFAQKMSELRESSKRMAQTLPTTFRNFVSFLKMYLSTEICYVTNNWE